MASRQVVISLYKVDVDNIGRPGRHLVTFDELEPDPVEAARAWLQVRGYQRSVSALDNTAPMITDRPPTGGFHVGIYKTNAILVIVRWPVFDADAFVQTLPELSWLIPDR